MPMIDVHLPEGVIPDGSHGELARRDPGLAARTWVVLSEAAEGGWGVAGFALGQTEFASLRGA